MQEGILKLKKDAMKLCIAVVISLVVVAVLIASPFINASTTESVAEATNDAPVVDSNSSIGITAIAEKSPATSGSKVGITAYAEKTE